MYFFNNYFIIFFVIEKNIFSLFHLLKRNLFLFYYFNYNFEKINKKSKIDVNQIEKNRINVE